MLARSLDQCKMTSAGLVAKHPSELTIGGDIVKRALELPGDMPHSTVQKLNLGAGSRRQQTSAHPTKGCSCRPSSEIAQLLRSAYRFNCAKVVLHVSHGNGRRCALSPANFCCRDTCRERNSTPVPGNAVLDPAANRFPCDIPQSRIAYPLLRYIQRALSDGNLDFHGKRQSIRRCHLKPR